MNKLTDLRIDDLVIIPTDKSNMSNIVRVTGVRDEEFWYLLAGELMVSDVTDIIENLTGEHRETIMECTVVKLTCI